MEKAKVNKEVKTTHIKKQQEIRGKNENAEDKEKNNGVGSKLCTEKEEKGHKNNDTKTSKIG